jgi:hypothetical protein
LVARFGADADAFGAGEFEDCLHAGIAAGHARGISFLGYADVIERAGAGSEGLFYWVQAVENIHCFSVMGEKQLTAEIWLGGEAGSRR